MIRYALRIRPLSFRDSALLYEFTYSLYVYKLHIFSVSEVVAFYYIFAYLLFIAITMVYQILPQSIKLGCLLIRMSFVASVPLILSISVISVAKNKATTLTTGEN